MYAELMDVSVSALRSNLAEWIGRIQRGEDVVITDRGKPVARLVPIDYSALIDRLTREGVLGKPLRTDRPRATGAGLVRATGSVSEFIGEQRR